MGTDMTAREKKPGWFRQQQGFRNRGDGRGTDHDRQAASFGSIGTSRYRRVKMIHPLARKPERMLFRRFRRNRTQVYDQASRANTLRGTEFEKHAFDHRPVFEDHAYDIGLGHGISGALCHFGPAGRDAGENKWLR